MGIRISNRVAVWRAEATHGKNEVSSPLAPYSKERVDNDNTLLGEPV